ncbi:hypothetical protein KM043_018165 [Ampulex compressa]|nr:hypothetical protein KM043_018165 [Ampulex compressa]
MAISSDGEIHSHGMIDVEIPQLPTDVIIHIMSFLTVSDRMAAGLVNRAWREASLTMKFLDKQAVCVGQPCTYNLIQISEILRYSVRPFYHFIFKKIELQRSSVIWDLYGPQIRSLILALHLS